MTMDSIDVQDDRFMSAERALMKRSVALTRVAAASLAIAVALVACSAPDGVDTSQLTEVQRATIESAVAAGADAAQLQILIGSFEDGEVTFAALDAATSATFECFEAAGIPYSPRVVSVGADVKNIEYTFSAVPALGNDESLALADACMLAHSLFVEGAYQTQPRYIAAQDAAFDPHREDLAECLAELGIEVSAGDKRVRLIAAALEQLEATGVDCLARAGVTF